MQTILDWYTPKESIWCTNASLGDWRGCVHSTQIDMQHCIQLRMTDFLSFHLFNRTVNYLTDFVINWMSVHNHIREILWIYFYSKLQMIAFMVTASMETVTWSKVDVDVILGTQERNVTVTILLFLPTSWRIIDILLIFAHKLKLKKIEKRIPCHRANFHDMAIWAHGILLVSSYRILLVLINIGGYPSMKSSIMGTGVYGE